MNVYGKRWGGVDILHPRVLSKFREALKTFIFLDAFGASSIDIMQYCFTKKTEWEEWLAIKEKLALKIKEIVEGHVAGLAFSSTSLSVEALPFGKFEVFLKIAEEKSNKKVRNPNRINGCG
jgi:small-conductance mechanosensitive channel